MARILSRQQMFKYYAGTPSDPFYAEVDSDPSLGAGTDLPEGSYAVDTSVSPPMEYFKCGPLATAWRSHHTVLARTLWVDFVGGNDTTGNGSADSPFKTVAAANAYIATIGSSTNNRWTVMCSGGVDTEPLIVIPTFATSTYISYWGSGADQTVFPNGFSFVGLAADVSRIDFVHLRSDVFTFDVSLSLNVNVRSFGCIHPLTWNGGPDYPVTQANNFLSYSSQFGVVNIIDGAVHLYNNEGIFTSLTIGDGPVVNSKPFLEMVGGLLQGVVTMSGKAAMYARGILNQSVMTGNIVGANTPIFQSDKSSFPIGRNLNGTFKVTNDDGHITRTNANIVWNGESVIEVDTALGNVVVTLPKSINLQGFPIIVNKASADANQVIITPDGAETINGNPTYPIALGGQTGMIVANALGTGWIQII